MAMVIPMSQGQKPNAPAQAMPSQTELLMALSEMHKQGHFGSPSGVQQAQFKGNSDWEKENWNSTWKDAESYSSQKERDEKIKNLPPGREYFDEPHKTDAGRGLLFYRDKKSADPLVGENNSLSENRVA